MKTYSQVYNTSRAAVQEHRKKLIEMQKVAVCNVLKETFGISGKLDDLDSKTKAKMAKRLLEYWSPKTGITNAGEKLINQNRLVLTANSSTEDVRKYIEKQTVKNIAQITECFRLNQTAVIVESFNDDIHEMTGKKVKDKFIIDTVWPLISERIKKGL